LVSSSPCHVVVAGYHGHGHRALGSRLGDGSDGDFVGPVVAVDGGLHVLLHSVLVGRVGRGCVAPAAGPIGGVAVLASHSLALPVIFVIGRRWEG